jgi:Holliday junction resolvase RusA-like endonuclease
LTDTTTLRWIMINVPMAPPSKLFPNQASKQAHWAIRSRLRAECREVAYFAARAAVPLDYDPITVPVELELHIGYPSKRRLPDLDASISGAKALLDGVVDAGVLADDNLVTRIVATHEKLPKGEAEFTRLTFTELEPEP